MDEDLRQAIRTIQRSGEVASVLTAMLDELPPEELAPILLDPARLKRAWSGGTDEQKDHAADRVVEMRGLDAVIEGTKGAAKSHIARSLRQRLRG